MRSRLGVRPVPLYIGLLTNCIYVIFWLLISLVRIHIPLWRVANGPLFFKKGRGVVRMTSPCCYWWEPWSLAADLTLDTKQEGHTVRGKQPKIRQLRHNNIICMEAAILVISSKFKQTKHTFLDSAAHAPAIYPISMNIQDYNASSIHEI